VQLEVISEVPLRTLCRQCRTREWGSDSLSRVYGPDRARERGGKTDESRNAVSHRFSLRIRTLQFRWILLGSKFVFIAMSVLLMLL
jgi:hypothetical protein